ncbi:hypothetical protein CDV36_000423 [Fusarium kuroshium]|uniref:Uncharacterized protein n=1 Tax=Fusarium kuroshium TaxID=2010991 RepID=A0A3M2SR66_9HYPO|nr:hypothetical protein CDV36_000423 [Fusarium kuroshium]
MDSFPLRSMTDRGRGDYSHLESHDNPRQVSENVHERFINDEDDAPLISDQTRGSSAHSGKPQLPNLRMRTNNPDNSSPFIPITEEEARRTTNLPKLNFRPTALKTWYLSILMLWQFLCMGSVVALIVLGETQPPWFRFGSRSSFWVWLYMPGLIGFLTTISWRGTVQWYNRIIPYVRMANIPTSHTHQGGDRPPKNLLNMSLNGVPSESLNPG